MTIVGRVSFPNIFFDLHSGNTSRARETTETQSMLYTRKLKTGYRHRCVSRPKSCARSSTYGMIFCALVMAELSDD